MQTIIVIIIICLAAAYLIKTFIRNANKKNSCGCGCTSCPTSDACDDPNQCGEKDER